MKGDLFRNNFWECRLGNRKMLNNMVGKSVLRKQNQIDLGCGPARIFIVSCK
jgi:hypothetical protein